MSKEAREQAHAAVMEAVAIDPLNLEAEFVDVPARLAEYNELYARAFQRHLACKHLVERTHALVYLRKREEASGERVTEALLTARVETDEEYVEALRVATIAEANKVRLWGVLDALRAKKDALISIGAHARAELNGSPSLRGEHRGSREVAQGGYTPGDTDDDDA